MFQGLFKRAERSIDSVVAKYVGRATVAVPLLVAAGFATAAATVKLAELYGPVTAYAFMAALFSVLGVLMTAIGLGSRAAVDAQESATSEDIAETEKEVESLLTPELTALLTTVAPTALPSIMRAVLRNLPLVFLLGIMAYLFSRASGAALELAADPGEPSPAPQA
jgi:hypothetical protein